ncbi:hypothetical protein IC229_19170 [Spirosoma sp. BT702]|uniref:Uncharacterized protein n=1 Tax=Spirosoma profusum TaxID=2771354 RepID=A0A927AU71_9BACT|nr:hypothetical protein [Spirosoma profusum]MBD2702777.1 hypothetical protein [Spirosoma profusum]
MKQTAQRGWQFDQPVRKTRPTIDTTTALGSLTVALLAYIVYHVYPLISKGILF